MKIAGGVVLLLAAILCFSSGACNLAGAGAGRAGKSVVTGGLRLLEQSVGGGAGGLSAEERRLLRERGIKPGAAGEKAAMARVKKRAAEAVRELEGSSSLMMAAGALSAVGGLLAFAGAVLLIVGRSRGFILAAIAVAMAGTAAGWATPFSVAALAAAKLALLAFAAAAAMTLKEEDAHG